MKTIKEIGKYLANCIGYIIFKHKMKIAIFDAFNHADEWIKFVTNFAIAYKDATSEDISKDFMMALAGEIHKDKESQKVKND